jgi:hypothetical protein
MAPPAIIIVYAPCLERASSFTTHVTTDGFMGMKNI